MVENGGDTLQESDAVVPLQKLRCFSPTKIEELKQSVC